jgi:hypothetical protein
MFAGGAAYQNWALKFPCMGVPAQTAERFTKNSPGAGLVAPRLFMMPSPKTIPHSRGRLKIRLWK